jgi:threonine dehydrogenase-like Zn-dependent dehydrogenase
VPDSIPDQAAVFTEPLAAALEILEQVHIFPQDRVLLIGAGRLGQLIAQTLALNGCQLQVLARHPRQKELLAARGIALADEGNIENQRFDIVIEATGSGAGFFLAQKAVRPRGTIVLKSTYQGDLQVNFSTLVVNEIRITGSRCGPFEPALRLLSSGLVDPTPLIDSSYSLDEGVNAFQHAGEPGVLKVLIQP